MAELYQTYKNDVEFFLVYIKEAHAIDSRSPSSFKAIEDPINIEERTNVCVLCIDDLNIPIPAIVDKLDDRVNLAYGAHPDRLYLVGRDGRIAFAGDRGPRGFKPEELEDAIVGELEKNKAPASANPSSDLLFSALDLDENDSLSEEEMIRALLSLRKLDKNGDGQLSREETSAADATQAGNSKEQTPPRSQGRERPGATFGQGGFAQRLKDSDANGDGKLSRDEVPERMRGRFDFFDENGDDMIDAGELESLIERFDRRRRDGAGPPERPDRRRPRD